MLKRAVKIVEAGQFDAYWTSALVFAAAGHSAARRGDTREARQFVRRAARLRPLLTYALPIVSLQALLELAHTYLALVDPAGARAVLEQAHEILRRRPDLGRLATGENDFRTERDHEKNDADELHPRLHWPTLSLKIAYFRASLQGGA